MLSGRFISERCDPLARPVTWTVAPVAPSGTAMPRRPAPRVAPATRATFPAAYVPMWQEFGMVSIGDLDSAEGGVLGRYAGGSSVRRGVLDTKIEHPFSWDSGRVFPGPTVELSTGREDVEAHCQWQGLASLT
ncbi:hypothetical protein GA0115254_121619 [Streptomyces sp. Ncost-T10-10d]|nr:hypothetical protein GA0115254_121619 [Streptomyces sp. Ncost-T10-10d]